MYDDFTKRLEAKIMANLTAEITEFRRVWGCRHTAPYPELNDVVLKGSLIQIRFWLELAERTGLGRAVALARELT